MDEKEKNPFGVNFAEASNVTLEYIYEKMKDGDELNEERAVAVTLAGADALAKVLVKAIADPWFECKYPSPCFMIFPAAFKIAEKAWEKLMEHGAQEGFLKDAIPAVEQIVNYSEEEGFLHKVDEIKKKTDEMRGAKNGE